MRRGIGAVRYACLVPSDAKAAQRLAKPTLTNLYNERPAWLDLADRHLVEAGFAVDGWEPDISADEIPTRQLALIHVGGAG